MSRPPVMPVSDEIDGGIHYEDDTFRGYTKEEKDVGCEIFDFAYPELYVERYGASPHIADNTDAFNTAIQVANLAKRCIIIQKAGVYNFATTEPLTKMTGCLGILGPSNGAAFLSFNHTNDSIVAKGAYKRFENVYARNVNETARASRQAVLRIQNCAYGYFHNLYIAGGADNQACIMLEQVYEGVEEDGSFMAHLGCWYNTFINVTAGYLATGANLGVGLMFYCNENAIGVVNPIGAIPGTYSGAVSNNTVFTLNSESFEHGLYLLNNCNGNVFIGGQMLGSENGFRLHDSSHNRFYGLKLNQVVTNPIFCSGTSARNFYDVELARPGVSLPWSFGSPATTDEIRHRGDGSVWVQQFNTPVIISDNDGATGDGATLTLSKHKDYDHNGLAVLTDTAPSGTRALVKVQRGTQAIALFNAQINESEYWGVDSNGGMWVADGMAAPAAASGKAFIFVDSADGDLKVRFGDGVTKTISTDT